MTGGPLAQELSAQAATDPLTQAVAELTQAYQTGRPCPPLRERLLPPGDLTTAYAVQRAQLRRWLAEGRRLVGAKIGLTNPAVQRQLGVDQPDYGMLFADMDLPHGAELPWQVGAQWKAEAELAFVLSRDLPAPDTTMAEVLRAVEYVVPAIDI
ncbi:MAG TPA: 2-keto-4-pentenoate hydratase, partial [Natronosporangium sp.]|nr:2-keto-4-pentenoate hydratase [Natronosporangium sp.]